MMAVRKYTMSMSDLRNHGVKGSGVLLLHLVWLGQPDYIALIAIETRLGNSISLVPIQYGSLNTQKA